MHLWLRRQLQQEQQQEREQPQEQKRQRLALVQPRQVRASRPQVLAQAPEQPLLLFCHRQPGQQRQRWLPKRGTCSCEMILDE
ncbi:MAG: hypothetical protein Q7T46_10840 [Polaromonas sp.]|nr:hypothetical protein [Polaromonas sp.]